MKLQRFRITYFDETVLIFRLNENKIRLEVLIIYRNLNFQTELRMFNSVSVWWGSYYHF